MEEGEEIVSDVTGPISSLPGSVHAPGGDGKCDYHPDREAITRFQGETDSFGCEMHDLCKECADDWRAQARAADTSGICDWCKTHAPKRRDRRDYEEGMHGRVYQVCHACIDKENARYAEELNDRHDDDPFDEDDCGWEYEDEFDCHMTADGSCGAAGSEDCEFECPNRRQQRGEC